VPTRGTTPFGAISGRLVDLRAGDEEEDGTSGLCAREGGGIRGRAVTGVVEWRDGAGLRTPFLGGAGAGAGPGAPLNSAELALPLRRAPLLSRSRTGISCGGFAEGRLRGKNMSIGLRGGAFEEGRGAVCALGRGGVGVVPLGRLEGGEVDGQTWSPS
jgi:hypothetical protein